MEYRDYYQTLDVPRSATQADIKKAYRRLARELHPDRNPGNADAEKRFKDANEAHAVLSDSEKRQRYDQLGPDWQNVPPGGGGGPGDFASAYGGAPGGAHFTYRTMDPGDAGGFSDFFRTFFTNADMGEGGFSGVSSDFGSAPRARAAQAQATAEITLAEVIRGTNRVVEVEGRRLQLKIPVGVTDGQRIAVRQAAAGTDLLLTVRIKPDPRFERHGSDLVTELPLSLSEALLGGEVRVPTPTGSVKVRIRPNTQNGQRIHLAGRGLPKRGRPTERGDLIVRIQAVLPHLDEPAREDFRAFAEAHPQPDPR